MKFPASSEPVAVVPALDPSAVAMVVSLVWWKLKYSQTAAVTLLAGSILDGLGISTLMSAIYLTGAAWTPAG